VVGEGVMGARWNPDAIGAAFVEAAIDPSRWKLAMQLAAGEPLEAAAAALGVTKGTARIQLKTVFAKLDVHRQSELVALLARLLNGRAG
jgi:DNA-binding NarL/FixJ family response regulator